MSKLLIDRSVFAALVLVFLFFMFWIALFLTTGILQWVLSILILIIFAFRGYI